MARRGRKRRDGRREPSGRLERQPPDTPEHTPAARRRVVALGKSAALDPRSAFAWGQLLVLRALSTAEYLAGLQFARDHRALFPQRTPPSCLGHLVPAGEGTIALPVADDYAARARSRYEAAVAAGRAADPRGWRELVNVLIYDRPPDWLDSARQRTPAGHAAAARDHAALRRAAAALLAIYPQDEERGEVVLDAAAVAQSLGALRAPLDG